MSTNAVAMRMASLPIRSVLRAFQPRWSRPRASSGVSQPPPASNTLGVVIGGDTFAPRHFGDAFHAPRGFDDLLQVRQVLDLDERGPAHAAADGLELHAPDVRPRCGNGASDVRIESAPVVPLEREPDDEALAFLLLPTDLG